MVSNETYSLKKRKGERFNKGGNFWETFREIFSEVDRNIPGFICCSICKRVFVYETAGNGTKSIGLHYKKCKPEQTLEPFVRKKISFSMAEKKRVLEAAVKFCCKDLRPFFALYGEGLLDFTEEVVATCSKYGIVSRESLQGLLPCPNTVSANNLLITVLYSDFSFVANTRLAIKQQCSFERCSS